MRSHHRSDAIKMKRSVGSGNTVAATRRRRSHSANPNTLKLYWTFFISVPSVLYMKPCMCVCVCVSAYHPSATLHCQPLWGGLICIVAVQLQNHNKISHECILGDISQMSSRLGLPTKYLGRTCAQSIRSTDLLYFSFSLPAFKFPSGIYRLGP